MTYDTIIAGAPEQWLPTLSIIDESNFVKNVDILEDIAYSGDTLWHERLQDYLCSPEVTEKVKLAKALAFVKAEARHIPFVRYENGRVRTVTLASEGEAFQTKDQCIAYMDKMVREVGAAAVTLAMDIVEDAQENLGLDFVTSFNRYFKRSLS